MPSVAVVPNSISTGDPCGAPPRPPAAGSSSVFAEGAAGHRVGDAWEPHACPMSSPHGAVSAAGSGNVFMNGAPVVRTGDPISCGSTVATGAGSVFAN